MIAMATIFHGTYGENDAIFEKFKECTDETSTIIKHIASIIGHGHRALDIGSGSGDIAIWLSCWNDSVIAVEPERKMLDRLREKMASLGIDNVAIIPKAWENAKIAGSFDTIICSHAMYFMKDWETSLRKMVAMLDDHGKAFIIVHADDDPFTNFLTRFEQEIDPIKARHDPHVASVVMAIVSRIPGMTARVDEIPAIMRFASIGAAIDVCPFFFECSPGSITRDVKAELESWFDALDHDGREIVLRYKNAAVTIQKK